jgi:hypothetical protein
MADSKHTMKSTQKSNENGKTLPHRSITYHFFFFFFVSLSIYLTLSDGMHNTPLATLFYNIQRNVFARTRGFYNLPSSKSKVDERKKL